MAERDEKRGLRRLLSPRVLWQAMKMPWYVWAAAAAVSLVAIYVLFQKLIIYAVIVAVVFFGSTFALNWIKGKRAPKPEPPKDSVRDWKRELDLE